MVLQKTVYTLLLVLFWFQKVFSEDNAEHVITGTVFNQLGECVSSAQIYVFPCDYLNTNAKNGSFSDAYKSVRSASDGTYRLSIKTQKEILITGSHKNQWFVRKHAFNDTVSIRDTLQNGGTLVFFTRYDASNLRNTTAYIYGTPFRVNSNKDGAICFTNIPKGTLQCLLVSDLPGYHDIVCSLHVRSAQKDTFTDTLSFIRSAPLKIKNLHAELDTSGKLIHLHWECELHINNGFKVFRTPAGATFPSKPFSSVKDFYCTDTDLQKFTQSSGYSYYVSYPGYINSDTVTVRPTISSSPKVTSPQAEKKEVIRLQVQAHANHKSVNPFEKIQLSGTVEPQTITVKSWQWSIRGSSFTEVTGGDTIIIAPATAGKISGILKVTADNGQIAQDTVTIQIESSSLRVEGSGDTTVGIYDQITLSSHVYSTKKVVSLGWDIGNTGTFNFTSDGKISIGPLKSPRNNLLCIVRAIDETGEQDFDTVHVTIGLQWDSKPLAGSIPNHKGQTLLYFNDRLWLIGGSVNDVWNSPDALSWNLVTDTAPFGNRYGHGAVVFQNKIWVIGGKIGQDSLPGDIYSSIDGKVWNKEIFASFLKRYYHTIVILNNELFLISGINDSSERPCLNDIWSTKDGRHWNQITESAEFGPRYGHGTTIFKNSIIVAGGFYDGIDGSKIYTDVWSSKNGKNWTKESNEIGFENNQFLTLLTYDNKLWAFGGFFEENNKTPGFSNISLSGDGISWTKLSEKSHRTDSYFISGVIFRDKITLSPSGNRSVLILK